MLIVEETFLLLTKDNGTAARVGSYRRHGLNAALLVDLAEAGVISTGEGRDPKVTVVTAGLTGNPVMDATLPAMDTLSGEKISRVVASSKLDPDQAVGQSLVREGILRKAPRRSVSSKYVTVNPAPEIALRHRLGTVLSGEREASLADAALLGILKALNVAYGLLGSARGDLDRRELARRIESVGREIPSVDALKRSVDSITASTTIAVTAAGAASTA